MKCLIYLCFLLIYSKMKATKIILFSIGIILGLILIIAAFLPATVSISRSIIIKSNPDLVYYQVANLKNWEKWSPFEAEDMSSVYSGPIAEPGMNRDWQSKSKGDGHMEMLFGNPGLEYRSKMSMSNGNHGSELWTFETDSLKQTLVTWTFTFEDLNYPFLRLMGLVSESVMGPVFEQGLKQLKTHCDSLGFIIGPQVSTIGPLVYASITDTFSENELQNKIHTLYFDILQYTKAKYVEVSGPSLAFFHEWNPATQIVFEAAFPVAQPLESNQRIQIKSFGKTKTIKFIHTGDYNSLKDSHQLIHNYIEACGFQINGVPVEEYLISPGENQNPEEWQTAIYYPVL